MLKVVSSILEVKMTDKSENDLTTEDDLDHEAVIFNKFIEEVSKAVSNVLLNNLTFLYRNIHFTSHHWECSHT